VIATAVWAIADEAFALPSDTGLSMPALSNAPTKGITRRKPGSPIPLPVPAAIVRNEGRPWGACIAPGDGDVMALCLRQVALRLEQAGIAFDARAPEHVRGVVSWVVSEPGGEWRASTEAHEAG
jgi:hypothetical protein